MAVGNSIVLCKRQCGYDYVVFFIPNNVGIIVA